MSKKTRSVLKSYFNAGDQPSEAQFANVFDSTLNLSEDNSITGSLIISGSDVSLSVQGHITASGNISSSGALIGNSLTLGGTAVNASAAELNLLDGVSGLVQADFTKLAAINTSAVELNYLDGLTSGEATQIKAIDTKTISNTQWGYVGNMNQNVTQLSAPTFVGLSLTKADMGTFVMTNTNTHALGEYPAGYLHLRPMPAILAGQTTGTYTLTSDRLNSRSTVLITSDSQIVVFVAYISDGACKIRLHNPGGDFSSANSFINIVIL